LIDVVRATFRSWADLLGEQLEAVGSLIGRPPSPSPRWPVWKAR
jgi:hypothetical protein